MSAQCRDMQQLIHDYASADPLEMPLRHSENPEVMTVTKLNVSCKLCGGSTQHLRGSPVEHSACLEVKVAGICAACKAITWARVRIYPGHVLIWRDGGIHERTLRPSLWQRIVSVFR